MLYDFKYDGFFSLKLKFHQGSLPRGANYKYYCLFFFPTLSTKRVNGFFLLTTQDSPDPLFFISMP